MAEFEFWATKQESLGLLALLMERQQLQCVAMQFYKSATYPIYKSAPTNGDAAAQYLLIGDFTRSAFAVEKTVHTSPQGSYWINPLQGGPGIEFDLGSQVSDPEEDWPDPKPFLGFVAGSIQFQPMHLDCLGRRSSKTPEALKATYSSCVRLLKNALTEVSFDGQKAYLSKEVIMAIENRNGFVRLGGAWCRHYLDKSKKRPSK